jgi:hypothetical protein
MQIEKAAELQSLKVTDLQPWKSYWLTTMKKLLNYNHEKVTELQPWKATELQPWKVTEL